MSVSRRDFVVGAVSLAALCATGGAAWAAPAPNALLRPVGGQDEAAFLAGCLRCDRCRSICPTGCIDIAHIEDGIANVRTPKMNFHRGACLFCNRCADVCPTEALRAIDPSADKIGVAVVDHGQCVAWKSPGTCSKCAEACPYGACSIHNGVPAVDARACNGCGECVYACPALSFTSTTSTGNRGIEVVALADYRGGDAQ